jgi:hypothetical protein
MKEMVNSNPCMSRLKRKYDNFFAAGGSPNQFVTARKVHMDIKDICLKDTVKKMVDSVPAGTGRTSWRSGTNTSGLPAPPTTILWTFLYAAFVRYM